MIPMINPGWSAILVDASVGARWCCWLLSV